MQLLSDHSKLKSTVSYSASKLRAHWNSQSGPTHEAIGRPDVEPRGSPAESGQERAYPGSDRKCCIVNSDPNISRQEDDVVISVRPAEPNEWRTYRDVRLRALLDSPNAFGSTYEAEAERADAMWSARIAEAASSGKDRVLFAFNRNDACGLVWCKLSATELAVANVFQMWVDPASRGMGAGRALLEGAIAWAGSLGVNCVRLGATAAETPAMRLYVACGFSPVGVLEPLRENSSLMVQSMTLALGSDRSTA